MAGMAQGTQPAPAFQREWLIITATMPDGTERKARFVEADLDRVREEIDGLDDMEVPTAQATMLMYWLDRRAAGWCEARLLQHYRNERRELEYEWSAGQLDVDVLALSLTDQPLLDTEGEYQWRRHRIGPVWVNLAKEVGPPPWPLPRVQVRTRRDRVTVRVGWRRTAYSATVRTRSGGPLPVWSVAAASVLVVALLIRRRAQGQGRG